jgi:peroxiredoxin
MKQYISSVLFLLGISVATAQVKTGKAFIIAGQLQNAAHQMVYLSDASNSDSKPYSDSITTDASGRFTFTGSIPEPRLFNLGLNSRSGVLQLKNVRQFYVENSSISLNGNGDTLSKAKIIGSKEDLVLQAFNREVEQLGTDKNNMDSLSSLLKRSVIQYPGSALSVNLVQVLLNLQKLPLADSLLKIVETTPAGKYTLAIKLRQSIDNANKVRAGSIAPDFLQPDTAGVAVALSGFKGKYVLLDFWASWCHPCRAENPNLVKAYEKYKDSNFTILSVSMDGNKASWLKAVQDDKLPWVQLSDLKGFANEAGKLYGITAIPSNFLIDPRGKIVASNLRGEELISFLNKLF